MFLKRLKRSVPLTFYDRCTKRTQFQSSLPTSESFVSSPLAKSKEDVESSDEDDLGGQTGGAAKRPRKETPGVVIHQPTRDELIKSTRYNRERTHRFFLGDDVEPGKEDIRLQMSVYKLGDKDTRHVRCVIDKEVDEAQQVKNALEEARPLDERGFDLMLKNYRHERIVRFSAAEFAVYNTENPEDEERIAFEEPILAQDPAAMRRGFAREFFLLCKKHGDTAHKLMAIFDTVQSDAEKVSPIFQEFITLFEAWKKKLSKEATQDPNWNIDFDISTISFGSTSGLKRKGRARFQAFMSGWKPFFKAKTRFGVWTDLQPFRYIDQRLFVNLLFYMHMLWEAFVVNPGTRSKEYSNLSVPVLRGWLEPMNKDNFNNPFWRMDNPRAVIAGFFLRLDSLDLNALNEQKRLRTRQRALRKHTLDHFKWQRGIRLLQDNIASFERRFPEWPALGSVGEAPTTSGESEHMWNLVVAVLVSTGSRINEVFHISEFMPYPYRPCGAFDSDVPDAHRGSGFSQVGGAKKKKQNRGMYDPFDPRNQDEASAGRISRNASKYGDKKKDENFFRNYFSDAQRDQIFGDRDAHFDFVVTDKTNRLGYLRPKNATDDTDWTKGDLTPSERRERIRMYLELTPPAVEDVFEDEPDPEEVAVAAANIDKTEKAADDDQGVWGPSSAAAQDDDEEEKEDNDDEEAERDKIHPSQRVEAPPSAADVFEEKGQHYERWVIAISNISKQHFFSRQKALSGGKGRIAPLLYFDAQQIFTFVKKIRWFAEHVMGLKLLTRDTAWQAGSRSVENTSNKITVWVQRYFSSNVTSGKELRAIWANMTFDVFKPKDDRLMWIQKILAHDEIGTALSYATWWTQELLDKTDLPMENILSAHAVDKTGFNALQLELEKHADILRTLIPRPLPKSRTPRSDKQQHVLTIYTRPLGRFSPDEIFAQMNEAALALTTIGLNTSYPNFRLLGFGSETIRSWKKHINDQK